MFPSFLVRVSRVASHPPAALLLLLTSSQSFSQRVSVRTATLIPSQMQLRCPAGARAVSLSRTKGSNNGSLNNTGDAHGGEGCTESSRCRRHAPSLFMLNFMPDPDCSWKGQTDRGGEGGGRRRREVGKKEKPRFRPRGTGCSRSHLGKVDPVRINLLSDEFHRNCSILI